MHTNKKVVFRVNNNLKVGGITRRLEQLLPLLLDDFEVHVVTYKTEGILAPKLREAGIHVHHVPIKGKWSPKGIMRLAGLFREHKADIVHTHSFGANISGILAASLAKVPVRIGQVHVRQQHWYGSTALRRKKQQMEEYFVHSLFSHKVLFPSHAALSYFSAHCPVSAEKLFVLHNGVRVPAVSSDEAASAKKRICEQYAIPQNAKIIGFVSRLSSGKGAEFILSFMERLHKEHPEYRLIIVGSSNNAEADAQLARRAASIGQGVVHFAGEQADPHPYYEAFDYFFFASESWSDALPGTVLEAAFHGLPILSRDNDTAREIAEYYPGIHFMADDDEPARAIAALEALPPADTVRLKENFSIQAMAEKTKKLYSELLQKE